MNVPCHIDELPLLLFVGLRDFRARPVRGFGTNVTSFSSSLNVTASSTIDGIVFECFGPDNKVNPGNRVGSSTLQIIGREVFFSAFCAVKPLAASLASVIIYLVTMATSSQALCLPIILLALLLKK